MEPITEEQRQRLRQDPRWQRVQALRAQPTVSDAEWEEMIRLETEVAREVFK